MGSRNENLLDPNKRSQGLHKSRDTLHSTMRSTSSAMFKHMAPLSDSARVKLWKIFEADYYRECLQALRNVRRQRSLVFEGLTQM